MWLIIHPIVTNNYKITLQSYSIMTDTVISATVATDARPRARLPHSKNIHMPKYCLLSVMTIHPTDFGHGDHFDSNPAIWRS